MNIFYTLHSNGIKSAYFAETQFSDKENVWINLLARRCWSFIDVSSNIWVVSRSNTCSNDIETECKYLQD